MLLSIQVKKKDCVIRPLILKDQLRLYPEVLLYHENISK